MICAHLVCPMVSVPMVSMELSMGSNPTLLSHGIPCILFFPGIFSVGFFSYDIPYVTSFHAIYPLGT